MRFSSPLTWLPQNLATPPLDSKPIEVVEEAKYSGLYVRNRNGLGASIAGLEQRFLMGMGLPYKALSYL
jgi:hypothetical protein